MFQFGTEAARQAPEFVPDDEGRSWLLDALGEIAARFGDLSRRPTLLTSPPGGLVPKDLDGLFELICGVQDEVGQGDVEFTLLEVSEQNDLPKDFQPLGDPSGQMLHAFARGPADNAEYVMLFAPGLFKLPQLTYASVARELGRLGLHRTGGYLVPQGEPGEVDWEAESELSAISLGMGVWVANGAYVFENGCCGGGCGIDLGSLRAGLSVPEVAFALAADAQRKGLGRFGVARHLEPTQKAAFRKNWSVAKSSPVPALAAPTTAGELSG